MLQKKIHFLVFVSALVLPFSHFSYGKTTEAPSSRSIYANLPEIEAKTFPVRIIRRSNSNRIYLIEDGENRQPLVGRILLFKQDEKPQMGFRVLKLYPDKQMIAAKRVRRYGNRRILEDGEAFLAFEKIADLNAPQQTLGDKLDLQELEEAEGLVPQHYDPDLDRGTSPQPEDELEDIRDIMTIEETKRIELSRHWLTAGIGYVRNGGAPIGTSAIYFTSANLRYAINLGHLIFLHKPKLQDSLSLETGGFLYKSLSFGTVGDSYTSISVVGALRYNVWTSQSFGFFFYAGLMRGIVLASTLTQASALSALNSTLPAIGGGLLFQIGPSWYIRFDMGLDAVDFNLVLRF